jgi:NAD(P)-dependent dehydrogenase (short-subunit alcohol dehydrogenase family)
MTEARRTVLITGATSGLGRAVAVEVAAAGHRVIVHGRDRRRVLELVGELQQSGAEVDYVVADLSDLGQTRDLAEAVLALTTELHVLVNNAGIGAGPPPHDRREVSADGHELRFAVNYLAPVLLARLLGPLLARSAPARIVNVASIGQAPVDFDDLEMQRSYSGIEAYFRSKFALVSFTMDLAEDLPPGVTANCLHPASMMDTNQVREVGLAPWCSVTTGVPPVLALVLGPSGAEHNGRYFDGLSVSRPHPRLRDPRRRARLRAVTDDLLARFERPA